MALGVSIVPILDTARRAQQIVEEIHRLIGDESAPSADEMRRVIVHLDSHAAMARDHERATFDHIRSKIEQDFDIMHRLHQELIEQTKILGALCESLSSRVDAYEMWIRQRGADPHEVASAAPR